MGISYAHLSYMLRMSGVRFSRNVAIYAKYEFNEPIYPFQYFQHSHREYLEQQSFEPRPEPPPRTSNKVFCI